MKEMSNLEMWLHFLSRHDEEALKYAIEHNKYIKEAEEEYQEILRDPEVLEECIIHELEKLQRSLQQSEVNLSNSRYSF